MIFLMVCIRGQFNSIKVFCRIVKHFIENCDDNGFNNLRFTIVDYLSNEDGLAADEMDHLLLKNEKFWIRVLITQHNGLINKHDLNRKKTV